MIRNIMCVGLFFDVVDQGISLVSSKRLRVDSQSTFFFLDRFVVKVIIFFTHSKPRQ